MKSTEIRKKLHRYLDEADPETLNFLNEAIVAYTAKKQKKTKEKTTAEPRFPSMTKEELYARIEQSEENLKNGKYLTEEQMDQFFAKLRSGRV